MLRAAPRAWVTSTVSAIWSAVVCARTTCAARAPAIVAATAASFTRRIVLRYRASASRSLRSSAFAVRRSLRCITTTASSARRRSSDGVASFVVVIRDSGHVCCELHLLLHRLIRLVLKVLEVGVDVLHG